jgi:hypothetical protein
VSATMRFMTKEPLEPWNDGLVLSRVYGHVAATHEVIIIVLIHKISLTKIFWTRSRPRAQVSTA